VALSLIILNIMISDLKGIAKIALFNNELNSVLQFLYGSPYLLKHSMIISPCELCYSFSEIPEPR